ncbi:MAG: DNA mismatch repair endonuclease MutL, partial [Gammaproteobacteria bacterium]
MPNAPKARPIHALSDALINQIAAGEVVERPASIVKELVENSLDAGAGAIAVEIAGGGIERICVSDDGHGIPSAELRLALCRHCTSKIVDAQDLERIVLLGFRGEALASIGAVAALELISRASGEEHAWSVQIGPRQPCKTPRPAAHPRGTTVCVRDLFAAIPARRHFLRRPQTELLHIQQLLRGIAFCTPGVTLSLRWEGARQWSAVAARDERSNHSRWRAVFGAEFARAALYVDLSVNGVRIFGWIGPADLARNQADLQYLAVNGRLIRDRQLSHAIRLAYGADLGAGSHAAYALHLEVAPDEVDVNVHPSKAEVRFRRIRDVHDLIYTAIRHTLDPVRAVIAPPTSVAETGFKVADAVPAYNAPTRVPVTAPAPPASAAVEAISVIAHRYVVQAQAEGLRLVDLWRLIGAQLTAAPDPPHVRALLFPVRLEADGRIDWALFQALTSPWGFEFNEIGPR